MANPFPKSCDTIVYAEPLSDIYGVLSCNLEVMATDQGHLESAYYGNAHTQYNIRVLSLSQICSKICSKCFWEFPKTFTYYALHSSHYAPI